MTNLLEPLTPAAAALFGALIGVMASVGGVVVTHWLTARRELAKEIRTRRALLAVIRGEVDAIAGVAVARREALSDLIRQPPQSKGTDVAVMEVSELTVVSQDPPSLGLIPVEVVTELFSLNATVNELNRVINVWSSKYSDDVMDEADLVAIRNLVIRLLEQSNDLSGLVGFKLKSPLGKVGIVLLNIGRIVSKLRASQRRAEKSISSNPHVSSSERGESLRKSDDSAG